MTRRARVALLGALLLASTGAVGGFVWAARRSAAPHISLEPLGRRRLRMLACDEGRIWLASNDEPDPSALQAHGIFAALAPRRASVISISAGGEISETSLGQGLVVSFGSARDRFTWAVVLRNPPDQSSGTQLLASMDGGRTWLEWNAPPGLIGATFESSTAGFAWSSSQLYRTDDGGRTWQARSFAPLELRRGSVSGHPVAAPDGSILVPLNSAPAGSRAALWRVERDLTSTELASWDDEALEGVAPANGDVIAVLRSVTAGGFRAVCIASTPTAGPREVLARPEGAMIDVTGRGRASVLLAGDAFSRGGGFLAGPEKTAFVSADGGRSWTRVDVTSDAVESVCLVDGGYWTLSSRYRRLTFHPTGG